MEELVKGWHRVDNYDWLSAYLREHNLQRTTRFLMAAIIGSLGVIPSLMLFSRLGPSSPVARAVSVVITVGCTVSVVLWLSHWPTRRQSAAFSVGATLSILISCLLNHDPAGGMIACSAFVALAGYVAFFHSRRYLAFTVTSAAVAALYCGVRLAAYADVAYAVCKVMVVMTAVLAIPVTAQVLLHMLGTDARHAEVDPLTGLANRRGFYRLTRALISRGSGSVTVVMIDLDDFKRINDTQGHAEGDRALTAMADILRETTPPGAVVARSGGEEFLLAHAMSGRATAEHTREIRERISATDWRLTASFGIASIPVPDVTDTDPRAVIDALIDAADAAMYDAKRSGGNQTRYAAA